ncbi:MAG: hypothetical protein ABIH39_06190 [Candidatus Margulisiibacteriota bacterium]
MAITLFPMIIPQQCRRIANRPTAKNYMGQQVVATRKIYEAYHTITYNYELLSSRQYRILNNHFRSMDGGKTSFYVVDWGDPRPVSAISTVYITVNNVQGFSINTGDGGNRIIVWQNNGDYGDVCTATGSVITDRSKAWTVNEWAGYRLMDSIGTEFTISSNTANTITVSSGSPMAGAYDIYRYVERVISTIDTALRKLTLSVDPSLTYSKAFEYFVLPVYECFYIQDTLGIEPGDDGFNPEPNDNYGPYYEGQIEFIQKGTGT